LDAPSELHGANSGKYPTDQGLPVRGGAHASARPGCQQDAQKPHCALTAFSAAASSWPSARIAAGHELPV